MMDVRTTLGELQSRIDAVPLVDRTPRRLLACFLEYAVEVVRFEGGENVDDWIVVESTRLNDPSHWYPVETRPDPGSLLLTLERTMYLDDDEGDFVQAALVLCTLVMPPGADCEMVGPIVAAAPSGHRLVDPDAPDADAEGPGSLPGYVVDHACLAETVLSRLGSLADRQVLSCTVEGNLPS